MNLDTLLPDVSPPAPTAPAAPADASPPAPTSPEVVHFYRTVTVPGPGYCSLVLIRGDELTITPELRAASLDRFGHSWLDLVHDPEAQMARWGEVRFAPGPWPEAEARIIPGSHEEEELIAQAWKDAWAQPTDDARTEALTQVRAKYGRPPRGNREIQRLADM